MLKGELLTKDGLAVEDESADKKSSATIESEGVDKIMNYEDKEGDPIIVWGHSLGADSTLEHMEREKMQYIFQEK